MLCHVTLSLLEKVLMSGTNSAYLSQNLSIEENTTRKIILPVSLQKKFYLDFGSPWVSGISQSNGTKDAKPTTQNGTTVAPNKPPLKK